MSNEQISDEQAQTLAYLKNRLTYPPPLDGQPQQHEKIQELGLQFAEFLVLHSPASRGQFAALERLEEAVMWVHAAMARDV